MHSIIARKKMVKGGQGHTHASHSAWLLEKVLNNKIIINYKKYHFDWFWTLYTGDVVYRLKPHAEELKVKQESGDDTGDGSKPDDPDPHKGVKQWAPHWS